jgi:hypothetical protein
LYVRQREVAMGHRLLTLLRTTPVLAVPLVMSWGAFRMAGWSPPAGIGLATVAVVTLVLGVRRLRSKVSPAEGVGAGELPSAEFDYIVWVYVGLPFVIVAILGLVLVIGAVSGSN